MAALAATTALAITGTGLVAAPAQADTEGCVTRFEFSLVKNGWGKSRVHRLCDTVGRQTSYYSGYGSYQSREYKACVHPTWSYVNVDYKWSRAAGVWKVEGKSAYWGIGSDASRRYT